MASAESAPTGGGLFDTSDDDPPVDIQEMLQVGFNVRSIAKLEIRR